MRIGKDSIYLFSIFVISTLLLFNLWTPGIYYSHDGVIHIARLAQFSEALGEKQIPVRWLDNWNFGFGYPAFVYIYSLPYYVGALGRVFNLNFQIIFKLLMYLSLVGSGFAFYFFARRISSKIAAFTGAIFYIAAPYRFADIFERGALGEALAFILAPLLFLAPYVLIKKPKKGFIFAAVIIFVFITTHALTFLIFLPTALAYSIFIFKKNFKAYAIFISAILLGFFMASFQWVPMIFEQKYIDLGRTYFGLFEGHLINVNQLLRLPKPGINIGTGIQLGAAQIVIILITLIFLVINFLRKKKFPAPAAFFLVVTLGAAFLTTNLSRLIWELIKPMQTLLFPWRFLTLTTFSCAVLACFIVANIKNKTFLVPLSIALIFLAIFPSRHYLKPQPLGDFSNQYYSSYEDPQKLDNYFLPKGLVENLDILQLPPASVIEGDGEVTNFSKQNALIKFTLNLKSDSKIQTHTISFPGWQLYVNGRSQKIVTNYPGLEGIIVTDVPKGKNEITLKFTETPLRKLSDATSVFAFILFIAFLIKDYLLQVPKAVKHVL